MSITRYASSTGEAFVWATSQPTAERDGTIWVYKFRAWCQRALAYGLIPIDGTAITDGAFIGIDTTGFVTTNLDLTGVSVTANASAEMVDVEFSFKYTDVPTGSFGGHYDGEIEQRSETTVRDVPVALVYGLGGDLEAAGIKAAAAGIDTIVVPGLKYYYTLYVEDFTWTEPNLITVSGISIAEVGSPTGLEATAGPTTPTANKWILQGKSIENVGAGMVKVSEEWEYSPVDWN